MKLLYRYYPLYIVLLALAITGNVIYGAFAIRSMFYRRIRADLEDTAYILKSTMLIEEPADLDAYCKAVGTDSTRITIIERSGVVLGDSLATPSEMENHGGRPEIKVAYLGAVGTSVRYSDTLERNMVYLALPSFDLSGIEIVLRVASPFRLLRSDVRSAQRRIVIVGLVLLILVTFVGVLSTRRLRRALDQINRAVKEYARGNLSFHPIVYRPTALRAVAETVSNLASNLLSRATEASRQRDEIEAVFAAMDEAVIVLDADLVIREMNESAYAFADVAPGEAPGKELLLVFRNSELLKIAERARKSETRIEGEIVLFEERKAYLQVHGSKIDASDAGALRVVLVLNDVSRLKNLERIRKDFVANVSHEIKTPITAAMGYVEALLNGDSLDSDTSREFLEITMKHIERLSSIVEDLLVISRLEQKPDEIPDLEPCGIPELLANAIQLHEPRAKEGGIELELDCRTDVSVMANPVLIEQAIGNLIDNAVKYSEPGGKVTVSAEQDSSRVVISVTDLGPGIHEKHLERIFERFYRVDAGRSRELGGTGLGLSIVKHIVLAHHGEVRVESVEGVGSTFTVLLPVADFSTM